MARDTEKDNYRASQSELCDVLIADDVVAIIAGLAATEVDGVSSMSGNITNEIIGKLGIRNLSKGVRVEVSDSKKAVCVYLSLVLKYGYSAKKTSACVQEKVANAISSMTGLTVKSVNVKIDGVELEQA